MSARQARQEEVENQSGPAGLMRGAEPSPVIGVEVLVEQQLGSPRRLELTSRRHAERGSITGSIGDEKRDEPPAQVVGHLTERVRLARAAGVFDRVAVAQEPVKPLERLDGQLVQREPHRSAPVRVAPEL